MRSVFYSVVLNAVLLYVCSELTSLDPARMDILAAFIALLLSGLVTSSPSCRGAPNATFEFPESFVIYTADHDIVNIFCPFNFLSAQDIDLTFVDAMKGNLNIFFVEADIEDEGYNFKGLYILKNRQATKLLANGRDFAAASSLFSKRSLVYIAATDGIYVYNAQRNKIEKYGTITDNLIGIAAGNRTDLYILSEDHVLYRVTDKGTGRKSVDEVKDAIQIVLDFSGNLFFLDDKLNVWVLTKNSIVEKINGLPVKPSIAKLLRPPINVGEGTFYVADNEIYFIRSTNTTAQIVNNIVTASPSAYSIEASLFHYYGYEKRIYHYNLDHITDGMNFGYYLDNLRNSK